ncbi:MAG: SDR family oxidoreductase [Chloroflexota bacterium]
MGDLVDGSAFVTGAGSGIGRAIATALAAAGAPVGLMDLNGAAASETAEAITSAGGHAWSTDGDTSSWADVDSAIGRTVSNLGALGIVVNAAGILDGYLPADEQPIDLWERVIAINLTGVFHGCKRALAELMPRGGGRIINIASAAGLVGDGGGAAYVAAKHGVVGLTRRIATTHGPLGITCNAICPGPIQTSLRSNSMDILGASAPDMANVGIGTSQEAIARVVPLARRGTVDEVAACAAFLASSGASYVNGLMLTVDGGWSAR